MALRVRRRTVVAGCRATWPDHPGYAGALRTVPPTLWLDRCAARRRPPSMKTWPLKTWPSFDAEGVGTAFSRLVEAFVLMNGRRGQRGDVIGQTGTMVLRWCRRERAPSEDRLLEGKKCDSCLFQR